MSHRDRFPVYRCLAAGIRHYVRRYRGSVTQLRRVTQLCERGFGLDCISCSLLPSCSLRFNDGGPQRRVGAKSTRMDYHRASGQDQVEFVVSPVPRWPSADSCPQPPIPLRDRNCDPSLCRAASLRVHRVLLFVFGVVGMAGVAHRPEASRGIGVQ